MCPASGRCCSGPNTSLLCFNWFINSVLFQRECFLLSDGQMATWGPPPPANMSPSREAEQLLSCTVAASNCLCLHLSTCVYENFLLLTSLWSMYSKLRFCRRRSNYRNFKKTRQIRSANILYFLHLFWFSLANRKSCKVNWNELWIFSNWNCYKLFSM